MCIGCTTVYPSAVLTLLALALMNLGSFSFAFPLAVTTFGANMPRLLIKDHRLSVFFNVFLGVSLGASLMSAVHAPANIQLGVIVVGLVVASFFTYIKGIRVLTTCRRCPRYSEFPGCHKPEAPSADG